MCDRAHLTHGGQAGLVIVHHKLAEETSTGPWAAELCPFPAPSALEAFSQLPMAVRGPRKITQE